MIEAVRLGTLDFVFTSKGPVGNFVPETRILDLPFLFRDYAHARKVLDSQIGQDILTKFPAKGLVAIAWFENGYRHVTNNKRPIVKPEDLKGLKLRIMENKVHMEAFKTLGALPTPMNINEVFTALQTGTVDGQENPVPSILTLKHYTVQKYVSLTSHVYSPCLMITSTAFWNKLSIADKAAFYEAAKIGVAANRKKVNDDEASGIAVFEKSGTKVNKVDLALFQKAVAPAYVTYNKDYGEANIKKIMDVK